MAKLSDYELKKLGQQAVDFFEDTRDIINLGKVAHVIVNAVPAWSADNGEMALYDNVAGASPTKRIYVRLNSSWELFAAIDAGGSGGLPDPPVRSIQFNSGGVFGGDAGLLWNSESSWLLVNGGTAGGTIRGTVALGAQAGTPPPATNDTTQLYGAAGPLGYGLGIVPEFNGPHILSDAVIFSGATVTVRNHDAAASLVIDGPDIVDGPAQLTFRDQQAIKAVINLQDGVGGSLTTKFLRVFYRNSDTGGYVLIENNVSNERLTQEDPVCVIGANGTFGSNVREVVRFETSNTIATQRFTIFGAGSASGLATVNQTTIGALATVYIQGPTRVADLTVTTGNYALWVDDGDVRIDGTVITGAATTQTKGNVFFTTTAIGISSNNTTDTTLIRGVVGTTSLVANTLSEGRTIRFQAAGYYNSSATPGTMDMKVVIGGSAILTTSSQTVTANASTLGWNLQALITCQTTGGAGTVQAQGRFDNQSSAIASNFWQMVGSSTAVLNTTGANVVEIRCQWGTANAANQLFLTNCVGELLN